MNQSVNSSDLLKYLDILVQDLTDEQKEGLQKFSQTMRPEDMTADTAIKLVRTLGLDIEKLQKNARRARAEAKTQQRKIVGKTKVNDPCRCGSGKKFKKCCIWKDVGKNIEKNAEQTSDSTEPVVAPVTLSGQN